MLLADLAGNVGRLQKSSCLGWVPPTEIPAWLSKCDVGILADPSGRVSRFCISQQATGIHHYGQASLMSRLKTIRHYFSERGAGIL